MEMGPETRKVDDSDGTAERQQVEKGGEERGRAGGGGEGRRGKGKQEGGREGQSWVQIEGSG